MTLKKLFMLFLPMVFSLSVDAQDFQDDTNDVPIDGGISVLLAAGLGYGAKKARDAYKVSKDAERE